MLLLLLGFLFVPPVPVPAVTAFLIFLILTLAIKKKEVALLFFIFLIPLLPWLPKLLNGPNFSFTEILFLLIFLIWLFDSARKHNPSVGGGSVTHILLFFSFLLICSCATVWLRFYYPHPKIFFLKLWESITCILKGSYPIDSFCWSFRRTLTWLEGIGFCLLLITQIKTKDFLEKVINTLIISGAVVACFGIFQYVTQFQLLEHWKIESPYLIRINSTLADPNSYGTYLASVIPLTLSVFFISKENKKIALGLLILLLIENLIFTASRISWIATAIGVLFVISGLEKMKIKRFTKIIFIPIIFLLIIIGILVFLAIRKNITDFKAQSSYLDVVLFTLNPKNTFDKILKNRLPMWKAAISMISKHPFLGVGVGTYPLLLKKFAPKNAYLFSTVTHAHNYFLEIAAEVGIIGLIIFLSIPLFILKIYTKTPQRPLLLTGIANAIICFLVTCLTGHPLVLQEMQFIFWLFIALFISTIKTANYIEIQKIKFRSLSNKKTLLLVLILILFGSGIKIFYYTDNKYFKKNFGLYLWEQAGDNFYFRWSNRVSVQEIPVEGEIISIPMFASHPDIEQKPVQVEIYLNKELVDKVYLRDKSYNTFKYLVKSADFRKSLFLTALVDRTWVPYPRSSDFRKLGIAFGKIYWANEQEKILSEKQYTSDTILIDFGTIESEMFLGNGWSKNEVIFDQQGQMDYRWSDRENSSIFVPLLKANYLMKLRIFPFVYPEAPLQTVKIYINRKFLTEVKVTKFQEYSVPIGSEYLENGLNELRFKYAYITPPKQVLNGSSDNRNLAIAFDYIKFIKQ